MGAFVNRLGSLRDEYPRRVERARSLMREMGVDALLLSSGPNLVYFTGAPGPLSGHSGSRPLVYILPVHGDPVLIVQEGPQFVTSAACGRAAEIRTYRSLSHLPEESVLDALRDRGLTSAVIGAELGGEMALNLPYSEFHYLRQGLSGAAFVDASRLLWRLRMVKSEAEIARLARACDITSRAYERTFRALRPGMTEAEIARTHAINQLQLGGNSPWLMILSGEGNYDLIGKDPGDRAVREGDMVWIDSGCAVDGYWSDFSRAAVLGKPTPEQVEAQREVHRITMAAVDMVRPGAPVADIAASMDEQLAALRFPVTSSISGLAARAGHGVGLDITELPSLSADDSTVLQSGMVITVEPGVATRFGTFHVEENVLVTQAGSLVLSTAPRELWEVRA